jgi:hypothetical protein
MMGVRSLLRVLAGFSYSSIQKIHIHSLTFSGTRESTAEARLFLLDQFAAIFVGK